MAYRVRTSLQNRYHPTFKFENVPPSFLSYPGLVERGVILNRGDVPDSAVEISKFKWLPDIFHIQGCWVVSETFKNLVEECEPNVHQFIPVTLKRRFSNMGPVEYYILNILQFIDAVDTEKSEVQWRESRISGKRYPDFYSMNPKIVFHRDRIKEIHIWRGKTEFSTIVFFSDYLVNQINRLRLKKIDAEYGEEK